jgi:hypothetical protein
MFAPNKMALHVHFKKYRRMNQYYLWEIICVFNFFKYLFDSFFLNNNIRAILWNGISKEIYRKWFSTILWVENDCSNKLIF